MTVKPIPDGYHAITPYLIIDGAARAIEFYKAAFGATELFRFPGPDGKIGHAELRIGDSVIMLADEVPERGILGPGRIGGSPVSLMLYVEGVDAVVDRAASHGAVIKRPVADQFYGDRTGTVEDPFGHQWHIATHTEDLSFEEVQRRAAAQGG
ncbi:MAG: VOC family protein [Aliidongia sp.]